ncbi:NAD(P)/FAD-dependent oxidoreductase [Streptomyces sp. NPDC050560]|uniref:NAD(P)/FAD-dependent oxidoreductase n=1 Tax=Streptomyces sp. NPDC050560 TaxID=3365630 RepID=UPI0037A6A55B
MSTDNALRDVVIVGASLAGLNAAKTLREEGYDGSLTVIGDEREHPYDRPPLSKELLVGESAPTDIALPGAQDLAVTWRLGEPAVALDARRRVVRTADGMEIPYAGLVLATGSGARSLPGFAVGAPHVHVLRTMADALRLRAALSADTRLLIVGCGFVGIEVASSARIRGAHVTVVGLDAPLEPAGPLAGAAATRLAEQAGVRLHVGRTVAAARFTEGVHRVELSDGTQVEADHVVVAVGSVPNIGWLSGSGAELGDGVLCDEALRVVGVTDAVAAGDIVRWPNAAFGGRPMRIEHWSNAVEQGAAAARTLLRGDGATPFGTVPSFWSDHFGMRLQSVGLPRMADRFEVIAGTPEDGGFAAAAYAGDVLVGGVAYGMPRALVAVRIKLARSGVPLEPAGPMHVPPAPGTGQQEPGHRKE